MKKIVSVCLLLILVVAPMTFAAELDAPAEKKITIQSEIERGRDLTSKIFSKKHSPYSFIEGVIDGIYYSKQNNTDSDAFLLGAYFNAWDWLNSWSENRKFTQFENDSMIRFYKSFREYQRKLDISDDQLLGIFNTNPSTIEKLKTVVFPDFDKK